MLLPDGEAALQKTYYWIEMFIASHAYPPAIFEIAEGRGIAYQTARDHLEKMQRLNWLVRDRSKRSILLQGIPDTSPAALTYNALAEMADRLAVAMAGHEKGEKLFEFFGEAYHVERARLEMEAQLVEAERLGEDPPGGHEA